MEERTVQRIGLDSVVYYVHTLKQQKNVADIQDGQDNNTHDAKDYQVQISGYTGKFKINIKASQVQAEKAQLEKAQVTKTQAAKAQAAKAQEAKTQASKDQPAKTQASKDQPAKTHAAKSQA